MFALLADFNRLWIYCLTAITVPSWFWLGTERSNTKTEIALPGGTESGILTFNCQSPT